MTFNVQSWGRISSSANLKISTLQDGSKIGAPQMYTYISGSDTVATIVAADYFASQAPILNVGDLIYAIGTDTSVELSVSAVTLQPASVTTVQAVGLGDVDGPAASTDTAIALFNGTTGKVIKNSVVLCSALGDLTGVNSIANGAGTEALPAYTFTGDLDTGMWHSAANLIDFSTSGLRAFQIETSPALAVDYIAVKSAATGTIGLPLLQAKGSDANIDVGILPKGTGGLSVRGATNAGSIKLWNQANTFFTQFQAGAVAQSDTYTTPLALPASSGMVLSCTTTGVQSWVSPQSEIWIDQTTTPVTLTANRGYIANNAGLVTLNMPAIADAGEVFQVSGLGAGGWLIQFNTGQTGNFGNSPSTVAGSFASTNRYDSVKILCVVDDTTFVVLSSIGNITVA